MQANSDGRRRAGGYETAVVIKERSLFIGCQETSTSNAVIGGGSSSSSQGSPRSHRKQTKCLCILKRKKKKIVFYYKLSFRFYPCGLRHFVMTVMKYLCLCFFLGTFETPLPLGRSGFQSGRTGLALAICFCSLCRFVLFCFSFFLIPNFLPLLLINIYFPGF